VYFDTVYWRANSDYRLSKYLPGETTQKVLWVGTSELEIEGASTKYVGP
jgi:hypothetical protein